jgi:triosephosphate isomerase (TIM)
MRWGAQDCSAHEQGAYTGEVSAGMLAEFGCRYVIVGHSERRAIHAESDQLVADKAQAALARASRPSSASARPWPARGRRDRSRGQAPAVGGDPHAGALRVGDGRRLRAGVGHRHRPHRHAAAGAGRAPVLRAQLQAATAACRQMKILYGGSVKADNAATLFAQSDIDGGADRRRLAQGRRLRRHLPRRALSAARPNPTCGVHRQHADLDHPHSGPAAADCAGR